MASDGAQLSVTLQANMAPFERQMDQAGALAKDAVGQIEGAFNSANPRLDIASSVARGVLGANLLTAAFVGGLAAVNSIKERLEDISRLAKETGQSAQSIFALQSVLGDAGINGKDSAAGLEALGSRLNEARRGEDNSLNKLFKANGINVGDVKDVNQALGIMAELVRNAKTEFDKIDIAKLGGLSKEWVKALEPGAAALNAARDAAAGAAPDIQNLVNKAADFDKAWAAAATNLGINLKAGANEFITRVGMGFDLIIKRMEESGVSSFLQRESAKLAFGRPDARTMGTEQFGPDTPEQAELKRLQRNAITVNARSKPTVVPIKNSGATTETDPERFFDTEERQARERTARMELEIQTLGQTTAARTTAMEALRLEQALERGGVTITDEYRQRIEKLAEGFGKATSALEQAQEAQQRFQALQNFAGNTIVDALDKATQKGANFKAIMLDVVEAIKRAAIQAAILGTGPLAGLFGTGGTGGQTGGLIGLLTNGLRGSSTPSFAGVTDADFTPSFAGVTDADFIPGFASGTGSAPGGLAWVGENGKELIDLPRGSQVYPADVSRQMAAAGGAVSVTHAPSYTINGDGMSVKQIAAFVDAKNQQFASQLPAILRQADRRLF